MAFQLRSSTIRLGIFISALVICLILVFQLTWLRKTYRLEQKEFDISITKIIHGLYEDLNAGPYNAERLNELIERPEPQLYIAKVSLSVISDSISGYLKDELADFEVFTNCIYGIYDTSLKKFSLTGFIPGASDKQKKETGLPVLARDFNYIALYFPNRRQFILSQMNFWIISCAILVVVLLLFSISLYFFYRQKFVNETQKDFLHSVTHELKTPVSVISLAADVLKEDEIRNDPGRLSTYAGIVEYQAKYLDKQISRLLAYAQTESGPIKLSMEKVNVHELIFEAVNNLAPLVAERKANLSFEMNAMDPIIVADRNYILVVITNLIDNAVKYAREPVIVITTKDGELTFDFSVQDNGIGIEKSQQQKIFKKFYRVRTGDTYITKGFGLGLTFVKTILDAHMSKINVQSELGQGSLFKVELARS